MADNKHINVIIADVIYHKALDSRTFVFMRPDGMPLPAFRAGQYLSVKMKIGDSYVSRPYSICSSPRDALEGKYEITVQSNPLGFAADWMINNLKKGDSLVISYPTGNFYYKEINGCKQVVALAGGSGITPFLSMAKAIRDGDESFALTILYGNQNKENILFKNELDEICSETDRVKVIHVLSDDCSTEYESGFINCNLIRKYSEGCYTVMVCGPESMYRFLRKELINLNLPDNNIRFEMQSVTKNVFDCSDYPKSVKKIFDVRVIQGMTEYRIKASAGEPVLVALERAGIKAPSCCRSGVCGWCQSKLISGECYMPSVNDKRTEQEKKENLIHPCASFPVTDLCIEVRE